MAPEVIRAELIERLIDVLLEVLDRLQIRMNRRCSIVAADQFLPHSLSVVTEISFLCDNAIPQTTGMLRSTEASPHGAQLATAATSRLERSRWRDGLSCAAVKRVTLFLSRNPHATSDPRRPE